MVYRAWNSRTGTGSGTGSVCTTFQYQVSGRLSGPYQLSLCVGSDTLSSSGSLAFTYFVPVKRSTDLLIGVLLEGCGGCHVQWVYRIVE